MKIGLRKISDIKPYPGNSRINDSAVDAVARSLKEFGFRQPSVVDKEGVIVVGHTRWKAAQKLGRKQVPVHAIDHGCNSSNDCGRRHGRKMREPFASTSV